MQFTEPKKYLQFLNEIPVKKLRNVTPETSLNEALETICDQRLGALMVEEGNDLVGMITETDFFLKMIGKVENWSTERVGDYMTMNLRYLNDKNTVLDYMFYVEHYGHRFIPLISQKINSSLFLSVKKLRDIIFDTFPDEIVDLGTGQMRDFFKDEASVKKRELIVDKYQDDILMHQMQELPLSYPPLLLPSSSVGQAILTMQEHGIKSMLVVKNDQLYGILTMMDILQKVISKDVKLNSTTVEQVMTQNPNYLLKNDLIVQAINNMYIGHFRNLPIVDQKMRPLAMATMKEINKYIIDHFRKLHPKFMEEEKNKLHAANEKLITSNNNSQPTQRTERIPVSEQPMQQAFSEEEDGDDEPPPLPWE